MRKLLFSAVFLMISSAAHAQPSFDGAGHAPIPDVRNAQTNPAKVNAESVGLYKELLLPEIFAWIAKGELTIQVARTPKEEFVVADDKEAGSCDPFSPLSTSVTRPIGRFFSELVISACRDPQEKGVRLLWNTLSTQWALGALKYDFDLFLFPDKQVVRRLSGNLLRIFPRAFSETAKLQQISREIISLDSPDLLKGYRWLTFRLGSEGEDAFWINSPAIKKVRQLTDSNRGDPLFHGAIAPDDFFGWSEKPQGLAVDQVEERTLLLPISEEVFDLSAETSSCYEMTNRGSLKRWNFQSSFFAGASGWVPTSLLWYPRKVFIVSGRVVDPYYSLGYESVVIDADTMLPVARVGLDRLGKLSKTSLGIISALEISNTAWSGIKRAPLVLDVIVRNEISQSVSVLSVSKSSVCAKSEGIFSLQSFDPTRFSAESDMPKIAVSK